MKLDNASVVVTGGASGLGRASAERLAARGAEVVIVDLPTSAGSDVAEAIGPNVRFAPADVSNADQVEAAVAAAADRAPLRGVVHCAGRGGTVRLVDREGQPGSLETFAAVVNTNLFGTFNVLRFAAAAMAGNDEVDGERGAIVLTASVAAYEGQIGQIPYAASKAGVVGMTIVAARDLSSKLIRVCTIAPGVFDTPILGRMGEDARARLYGAVPHPRRLGNAGEFAQLAENILDNPMLNGETIRLDGGLRMGPK
ncbi:SDR family NAD(P)-dependent oxidoreductase (plasmid) [Rhodococcus pyridinivorans]|uniref:SDR family NAD(P)-dependent oxidoreductase n=1 Tax=Rhodococcus TaxID=1827 RepID=UPI0007D9BD4F|nr:MULTISPECIES: SDR family NAD(P)-dependent oxidoreductase [Rhodococcus]MCT7293645.1 SDR family NAD(P)-dependent oxidoreductase [Rhodococcus sp. PAE-6]QXU56429.1 SDR family NAD(P)-dependent oxidoreductase [Rhodococcus sp. LW-XY12]UQB75798.1 SDR family NAD(P)-dependent oxidoreductase [Rhodococcus ruber]UVT27486.1 SDR family NAD(P)-dependent oxidoreductase [Rhodococcus pyridinivorans]WML66462.1 SDR family NAD(P)-dependent oxidoreductase [Rhodococcus sp. AH-ZY2]